MTGAAPFTPGEPAPTAARTAGWSGPAAVSSVEPSPGPVPRTAADRSASPAGSGPNRSSPRTPTGAGVTESATRWATARASGTPATWAVSTWSSSASQVSSAALPVSPVTMATRPCTRTWSLSDAIRNAVCDHTGSAVEYADSVTSAGPANHRRTCGAVPGPPSRYCSVKPPGSQPGL